MNGRPGALLGANVGKLSWSCRQQSRSLGSRAPKIKASPNMCSIPDSENMVFATGICILGQLRHISLVCYWFPHHRSANDVRLAQTWQYCPLPSADWPSGNISKSGLYAEKHFVPLRQKKKHPVLTWEAGRIRRIFGEITSTVLAGGQHLKDRFPVSGFLQIPPCLAPLQDHLSSVSGPLCSVPLSICTSTCVSCIYMLPAQGGTSSHLPPHQEQEAQPLPQKRYSTDRRTQHGPREHVPPSPGKTTD